MRRKGLLGLLGLILTCVLLVTPIIQSVPAFALTTADVDINATPEYVAISVNNTTYSFGTVAASSVNNTTTAYFYIDNTSTVQTDQTIKVTAASWSGGVTWTHSDTATPGADTAGLKANKGGTWGVGDVIVKAAAAFNNIAENQGATTDYGFGLQLLAPTSFGDGVLKEITVRVTAAAG